MLQKIDPLDEISKLPAVSRALAAARVKLEEARKAEEDALAQFRVECARTNDRGSIMLDSFGRAAESDALKSSAQFRLGAAEVERLKREHGATIDKHLGRYEPDCMGRLAFAIEEAHAIAAKLADVVARAEQDGGKATYGLSKARGIAAGLQKLIERLS